MCKERLESPFLFINVSSTKENVGEVALLKTSTMFSSLEFANETESISPRGKDKCVLEMKSRQEVICTSWHQKNFNRITCIFQSSECLKALEKSSWATYRTTERYALGVYSPFVRPMLILFVFFFFLSLEIYNHMTGLPSVRVLRLE